MLSNQPVFSFMYFILKATWFIQVIVAKRESNLFLFSYLEVNSTWLINLR